ncbi:MAG: Isopenicillin-N epimerase, partial [Planctomycetaceae bacterium]|nr:Isopenicillin-N epimerase [Planctomycetaceae bacterium]
MSDSTSNPFAAASSWSEAWSLRPGVAFLNHGSFGLVPRTVQFARQKWQQRLYAEPVDFYVRQVEAELSLVAKSVGRLMGAPAKDLVFVDNATIAMNIVAQSLPLNPGDQVLLTDHEYGAVRRIWQKRCDKTGAKLVIQALPEPLESASDLVDCLFSAVTPQTKLIVFSQMTSPTAVILPAKEICQRAREARILTCIDGPHALATMPLNLEKLGCDFYCASCHKWLCAPNGSGFLYVAKKHQGKLAPLVVSWGGSVAGLPATWQDEYNWLGTRDSTAILSIPSAIEFLEQAGWTTFRESTHDLAQVARQRVSELTGLAPLVPDSAEWYGPMISLPLPLQGLSAPEQGHRDPLHDKLWSEYQIEIPITWWRGKRLLRVSCHLYNTTDDIDRLVDA